MAVDAEREKVLNLLHGNPSYLLTERGTVEKLTTLPPGAGLSTVAGETRLANGSTVASVFEVGADGGELHCVYWLIEGFWHDSRTEETRRQLAESDAEIFPFEWKLSVALEADTSHRRPPVRRPLLP